MKSCSTSVVTFALATLLTLPIAAGAQDTTALAKQTQNPVSSLISVPFQGNWDFGIGDNDDTSTPLNFQPVVPFPVSKGRTSSCESSCR